MTKIVWKACPFYICSFQCSSVVWLDVCKGSDLMCCAKKGRKAGKSIISCITFQPIIDMLHSKTWLFTLTAYSVWCHSGAQQELLEIGIMIMMNFLLLTNTLTMVFSWHSQTVVSNLIKYTLYIFNVFFIDWHPLLGF